MFNMKEIENAIGQYGEIVLRKNEENNIVIMSLEEYKQNEERNQVQAEPTNVQFNDEITVTERTDAVRAWKLKYKI